MNREHLRAFIWLRWRLRTNQFRKAGTANMVVFAILMVLVAFSAVGLFLGGLLAAMFAIPQAPPAVRLFVWDGIVLAFLFLWLIGLLTELQRAEGLALDKFMQLPVSPAGAFSINYVSSLFSVTLGLFVAASAGFIIGDAIGSGPRMLLVLPLAAAFVLAVTAVTYQFQGWLAALMSNPRRRRTVIFVVTFSFIAVAQLPNLINLLRPWDGAGAVDQKHRERIEDLRQAMATGQLNYSEYAKKVEEANAKYAEAKVNAGQETLARAETYAKVISTALPPGWLAMGAAGLGEGVYWPALMGTAGYGLLAFLSLGRAYRTTLRIYAGEFSSGGTGATEADRVARPVTGKPRLVEWQLPRVSEYASGVATAALRGLLRAPEAKMVMLTPFILVVVMGVAVFTSMPSVDREFRPFACIGAPIATLLVSVALTGNLFGYDRSGFRAYVLSPAPRRDILLGKNLAVAPLVLSISFLLLLVMGIAFPMRIDHYPAALFQLGSAYLIATLLTNTLSIFAPLAMAQGSMRATNVKIVPVLLQFLFMTMFPVALIPVLAPIGLELLLEYASDRTGMPVSLGLSAVTFGLAVVTFRKVLTVQGRWLQDREKKILEVVTSKSE